MVEHANEHHQRGDVVGFAGDPAFPEGDILHAFIWTAQDGIKPLGACPDTFTAKLTASTRSVRSSAFSCDGDFVDAAPFIWENGVMTDLNALKPASYNRAPRTSQGHQRSRRDCWAVDRLDRCQTSISRHAH